MTACVLASALRPQAHRDRSERQTSGLVSRVAPALSWGAGTTATPSVTASGGGGRSLHRINNSESQGCRNDRLLPKQSRCLFERRTVSFREECGHFLRAEGGVCVPLEGAQRWEVSHSEGSVLRTAAWSVWEPGAGRGRRRFCFSYSARRKMVLCSLY